MAGVLDEIIVAIDLGTTFSSIAYVDEHGEPKIIEVDGGKTVPSVVLFNEDGSVTVGQKALNQALIKSHRVVQWIKQSMGEPDYVRVIYDSDSEEPQYDEKGQAIERKGKKYSPQQISAEILKKLVQAAERELGRPVKKAIITCPAWFTDLPRKHTWEAGELAGLEVLKIVNEPTAAALYYGLDKLKDGDLLCAYDFGGGTFDCSIIQYNDGKLEHLSSHGHATLGGHNLNQAFVENVARLLTDKFGENPLLEPEAENQLYDACERAKKNFRYADTQSVACTFRRRGADVEVTADQFDEWTEPMVDVTMEYTQKALDKLNDEETRKKIVKRLSDPGRVTWNDIDCVLLVGGSTRLRQVKAKLRDLTGKEPLETGMEDVMVALGAAILTKEVVKVGKGRRAKLVRYQYDDITPHALGVLARDEHGELFNRVIIPEGRAIPAELTDDKSFEIMNSEHFDVPVMQGSDEDYRLCSLNKTYRFECLPGMTTGARLAVTFAYDASNCIAVKAIDIRSGRGMQCKEIPFQIPQTQQATSAVDICFVVDATGSMAGCIEGVKRGITDFCGELTMKNFDYRLALIEYRDRIISEPTKKYDWTDDVEKFRTWVGALIADGGGDEPESALDGMAVGARMSARDQAARVMVLVTDASCHDPDYGQLTSTAVADLLKTAGIKLFAIAPRLPVYERLTRETGGDLNNFNENFRVGYVDPHAFGRVLGDVGFAVRDALLRARRTS